MYWQLILGGEGWEEILLDKLAFNQGIAKILLEVKC